MDKKTYCIICSLCYNSVAKTGCCLLSEVGVYVGYTEIQVGFLDFIFGSGPEVVKWQYAEGFVTPLDTHIVSAIVGLYFGAGFTK